MFDRPGSGEKAILVCVGLGHAPEPDRIEEFTALARADFELMGRLLQKLGTKQ